LQNNKNKNNIHGCKKSKSKTIKWTVDIA
jgi:hypothetical protein